MIKEKKHGNEIRKYIRTKDISESNNVIKTASIVVSENVGVDVK